MNKKEKIGLAMMIMAIVAYQLFPELLFYPSAVIGGFGMGMFLRN